MYDMGSRERTITYRPGNGNWMLYAFYSGNVFCHSLAGTPGTVFTVGRPSTSSMPMISIPHRIISRQQGEFYLTDSALCYKQLSRSNTCMINGIPAVTGTVKALSSGDVLRVMVSGDADDIVTVVVSRAEELSPQWQVMALDNTMAEIVIGRDEALGMNSPALSRRHASFFKSAGGWAVIDHNSTNGVRIDGVRIDSPQFIDPGDCIEIAGYLFFYTGASLIFQKDAESRPRSDGTKLTIDIEERNVWHRAKKKTLLKDIELEVNSGEMVLVLGGSGAGKTTFLNAVMGYEKAEGHITYNNMDIYEEYEQMKYQIGYVPQQDLLRHTDTVYDTLLNAAHMRMPSGLDESAYIAATDATTSLLGLEHEKESLVSKLSGGQIKRLSIAVEYIGNPSLFFLDEPDSGLDGGMARGLMENLRDVANQGKIVILISHSPDRAVDLFDKVIILAKDTRDNTGHLAFFGTPDEAKRFFETATLEAIVRRINRKDEGGEGMADYFIEKYAAGRRYR